MFASATFFFSFEPRGRVSRNPAYRQIHRTDRIAPSIHEHPPAGRVRSPTKGCLGALNSDGHDR